MGGGGRVIAEVLVATHGHPTAEELLAVVVDRHPDRAYGFEASLRHFATPGRCPLCAGESS